MFFNAPTLGFLFASPAFAAVLPLVSRDALEIRQTSGAGPFDGEATTFTGSPKSSCGAPLAAGAIAVALNNNWQKGTSPNLAACGKQITITNSGNGLQGSIIQGSSKGKTITATVQDTCPECDDTHIDLTTGAWNALTDNSKGGVVAVTWSFVGGAPDSSGGGSSSTTPTSDSTPAAAGSGTSASPGGNGAGTGGAGQTESKVAAQKASSPGKLNLATVPQSGDLAATLQQTGTGSGADNSTESITGDGTGAGTGGGTSSGTGGGTGAGTGGGTGAGTGGGTGAGASGGTAGKFFQCGGSSWSGPTSCESGTTCQVQNQYYSQCL